MMKALRIYINMLLLLALSALLVGSASGQNEPINNFSLSNSSRHRFKAPASLVSAQYLKDSTITYRFGTETDEWSLSKRSTYAYDQLGRQVQIDRSKYDQGVWNPCSRSVNSFGNGDLVLAEMHQRLKSGQVFEDSLERAFSYDYRDRIQEETTHLFAENRWQAQQRIGYTYNFEGQLLEELTAKWTVETYGWVNHSRLQFQYVDQDQVSREVLQLWNPGENAWVNEASRDFVYNQTDMLVSSKRSKWDPLQGVWVLIGLTSIEYNDDGQIKSTEHSEVSPSSGPLSLESQNSNYDDNGNLDELIISSWNIGEEDWEVYNKQNHYWSVHQIGNTTNRNTDINCTFSNPYTLGLPWYCSSLKTDVRYQIQVYDLLGRIFYQSTFLGQHTFTISDYIPSGIYLVAIQGGLDTHTEKIIIR